MRLAGHVTLITGAGGGIGAATARYMAREGAAIALLERDVVALRRIDDDIVGEGGRALAIPTDVARAEQVAAAVSQAIETFGRLDSVVANAGIQLHRRDVPLHELPEDAWDETHDVNLRGVYLTCRASLRQMLKQPEGGSIVIVSSVTALGGYAPQNPAYTASKGGIVSLGRALAVQYGPNNIRCNVVCPGALEATPNWEDHPDPKGRFERMTARIPLGRLGRFVEMAPFIALLASGEASYATGGIFVIDGGLTAR
ncbi:MAG: SDR family NAD(P)-dependent oxidoreductase [Chloroflexota bacterium]